MKKIEIKNDYKKIKVTIYSIFCEQNYNLLKKVLTH